ncbi:MAG: hypothetical protein LUI02_00150 [Clostridiales bacterium]|nr:hypothetical protein [Clostridiales bacterium]
MTEDYKISERFDVDDIRRIRTYNAERYSNMSPSEIVSETHQGAEKVLKLLNMPQKTE